MNGQSRGDFDMQKQKTMTQGPSTVEKQKKALVIGHRWVSILTDWQNQADSVTRSSVSRMNTWRRRCNGASTLATDRKIGIYTLRSSSAGVETSTRPDASLIQAARAKQQQHLVVPSCRGSFWEQNLEAKRRVACTRQQSAISEHGVVGTVGSWTSRSWTMPWRSTLTSSSSMAVDFGQVAPCFADLLSC